MNSAVLLLLIVPAVFGACPQDWRQVDSHCYMISHAKLTWPESQEMCRALGGTLATFENSADISAIAFQLHGDIREEKIWVDGTDAVSEGHWIWASNGHDVISSFSGRVSNNDKDKNCLSMDSDHHFRWYAESCHSEAYYICERLNVVSSGAGSVVVG